MAREETQVSKIRELTKERNRLRGERHRIHQKAPAPKRRKLENETYETRQESAALQEIQHQDKRKADKNHEPEAQPSTKRRKTADIRELFQAQADKNIPNCQDAIQEHQELKALENQTQDAPTEDQPGVYFRE